MDNDSRGVAAEALVGQRRPLLSTDRRAAGRLVRWGAPSGPPIPPTLRAPAEPWRSASVQFLARGTLLDDVGIRRGRRRAALAFAAQGGDHRQEYAVDRGEEELDAVAAEEGQ